MPTSYTVRDDDNGDLWVDMADHNKKTVSQWLGKATYITNAYKVLESNSFLLELEYEYLGETHKITIPRGDLKKSELLKHADMGLNVSESNHKYVIDFIMLQEEGDPPVLIHEGIGWDILENKPDNMRDIFKSHKGIGVESEYKGKLLIEPKGTLEDVQKFFKKHVNGSPLSLAAAFGLSAVLVGFLGDSLHCESLIIHLFGESTTGKSTAAILAVSMGSLPSFFLEQSLLNTFDGTENALLATLLGNRGYPCCFDEADANEKKDLSQFIYRLASGRGKRRLTKEGKQKDIETYMTTVITNGEKGLTQNSNQNTGKEIRVLSFSAPWTKSAAHAETVNKFAQNHYGWPVLYLAKYLLKIGKEEAMRRYEKNRTLFIEKSLVKNSFTDRLSGKYAFILLAAELANECMGLDLPFDYILDMLLQNEAESMDSRDIAQKAYDFLLEQVNVNIDRFSLADTGTAPVDATRDAWGIRIPQKQPLTYDSGKCTMIVCIAKEKFRELLEKGGFQEPSVIVKKFKERQWLDHDSDRDTRHRKITNGGTAIDVYALRVFEEPEDDMGEIKYTPKAKRKPVNKLRKPIAEEDTTISDILNDD